MWTQNSEIQRQMTGQINSEDFHRIQIHVSNVLGNISTVCSISTQIKILVPLEYTSLSETF